MELEEMLEIKQTELKDEKEKCDFLVDKMKGICLDVYPRSWIKVQGKTVGSIRDWKFDDLKANVDQWKVDYKRDHKNSLSERLEKQGILL